jgi:hypothetical protein
VQTHGEEVLLVADDAGTFSKGTRLVLVELFLLLVLLASFEEWTEEEEEKTHHFCETSSRHNVTRMHKTVEVSSALLNLLAHVIVDLHVKNIGDEI